MGRHVKCWSGTEDVARGRLAREGGFSLDKLYLQGPPNYATAHRAGLPY